MLPDASESPPERFVGWLGSLGCAAAGYGVFQALLGVLPDSLGGDFAKWLVSGVSGVAVGLAAWLAAALLRARARTGRHIAVGAPPVLVPPATAGPGPLPEVFAAAYEALVGEKTEFDDPVRGKLTGWSHSLGEGASSSPTALSTAYGLHMMLDLNVPDGRLSTGDLVDTLWRLRLPDGGWSARTQGSVARPEITALVLGALARAGSSSERLAAEVARCGAGFTPELDPAGRESTHVVTTVLRGLLRAAPHSAPLPLLCESLVEGAIDDPDREHLRCWGYRLHAPYGDPSPLHTAQAVVALDRAARVLGETAAARAARQDGVRWLLACPDTRHDACPDVTKLREEVRRPRSDDPTHHEVLYVRHFTATWLVRALTTPGAREVALAEGMEAQWRERLDGAFAAVWAGQTDGIWSWDRGDGSELRRPMWMTYQGLSALRGHAVWIYQPGRPEQAEPSRLRQVSEQ
ncbi:hypothetical protein [Streptomyces sp. V3I7]|uniref:hypothetical protein n=1 Tax=Streptomyces sp. V3I7 TaxID=3042278 RepID=UPI0027D85586|nr:hypothetical protein [Streptomyces sp. V3I7]